MVLLLIILVQDSSLSGAAVLPLVADGTELACACPTVRVEGLWVAGPGTLGIGCGGTDGWARD